jgi:hypothetical protein
MVQNIQPTSTSQKVKDQPTTHRTDKDVTTISGSVKVTTPPAEQDQDLSYSDTDSYSADNDEKFTAVTIPSTINTVSSQESKATHLVDTRTSHARLHLKGSDMLSLNDGSGNECDHVNKIDTSTIDDIRKVTRSHKVHPSSITREDGWNNITAKSKNSVQIRHAIISPQKLVKSTALNKDSPNYNRYVTSDSDEISKDLGQDATNLQLEDCSTTATPRMHESGHDP